MKNLVLIRHANADHKQPGMSDFDRTLSAEGERDAVSMCKVLRDFGLTPQRVIASSAVRVQATVGFFVDAWSPSLAVEWDRQLYLANENTMLEQIAATAAEVETLFVFAHNPGLSFLSAKMLRSPALDLPTSGMVGIKFAVASWEQVARAEGELIFFEHP